MGGGSFLWRRRRTFKLLGSTHAYLALRTCREGESAFYNIRELELFRRVLRVYFVENRRERERERERGGGGETPVSRCIVVSVTDVAKV